MLAAFQMKGLERVEGELLKHAVALLSQQVWCWGRDILRPEGNWLVEMGFDRTRPPAEHKHSSSLYVLTMPRKRCVVLRAFGVFYGDGRRGGVFLPRYTFQPRYSTHGTLDCLSWPDEDLLKLKTPTESQQHACATLTLDLIDWIRGYEVNIVEHLGIEYRRSTLLKWDNGERTIVPAENIASAWRELSFRVAANFNAFLRRSQT